MNSTLLKWREFITFPFFCDDDHISMAQHTILFRNADANAKLCVFQANVFQTYAKTWLFKWIWPSFVTLCFLDVLIFLFVPRSLVFKRIANEKVAGIHAQCEHEYSYWQALGLWHLIFRQTRDYIFYFRVHSGANTFIFRLCAINFHFWCFLRSLLRSYESSLTVNFDVFHRRCLNHVQRLSSQTNKIPSNMIKQQLAAVITNELMTNTPFCLLLWCAFTFVINFTVMDSIFFFHFLVVCCLFWANGAWYMSIR